MLRIMLLALLWLLPAGIASAASLSGEVHWQGQLHFEESVRVEPGATLTVAPGSEVVFSSGGLEVVGTLVARDCSFSGDNWGGLVLKQNSAATRLENVTVRGARTGIFIGGGAPRLQGVTLRDNDIGVEIKQKSRARLVGCRFEENRKVGLFIKDDSSPQVSGCRFVGNGRYGAYIHRSSPAGFTGNLFLHNPTGLVISHYGSNPQVRNCRFEGNDFGLLVDRAALPQLTGNRFEQNRVGLKLHRRSDAEVSGNLFQGNDLAILVSFSSYPRIGGNDFVANAMALRLEYQSAQWETARGAAARAGEVARQGAFGGQHSPQVDEEQRRAYSLDGTVSARDNWWGDDGSAELESLDGEGNPSFIDDGRDRPQFEEEGQMFPLDRVDFAPWRKQAQFREKS